MQIHESQVSRQTTDGKVQFIGEASTLGLAPGEWPQEVTLDFGNDETVTFSKAGHVGSDDLVAVIYTGRLDGKWVELHILND